MMRTPSGRILEIVFFAEQESKRLRRELSRPDIAAAWEANFQSSDQSEKVCFAFIDAAMKVHAGILRNPEAAAIIASCEDPTVFPKGSPWTVYKLVEVVRKSTSCNSVVPNLVVELLGNVIFRVRHSWLEPGELTVKGLSGRGSPGNRGLLDLALLQHQLRNHFLNETLASMVGIQDSSKATLRKTLATFSSFAEESERGLAWLGVTEQSVQLLHTLIRTVCFSNEYDSVLKRSLHVGQSIPELLSQPPLCDQVREILDAIPQVSVTGGAGSAAGSAAASSTSVSVNGLAVLEDGDDGIPLSQEDTMNHPIALGVNLANDTVPADAKEHFKQLDPADKQLIKEHELEALRIVDIGCQFLIEKPNATEVAADIRQTERAQLHGSPIDGYCMFVYVPRVAAESATAPGTRLPHLRANPTGQGGNHLRKLLTAVMMARSAPGENYAIDAGDLYIIADSGRCAGVAIVQRTEVSV